MLQYKYFFEKKFALDFFHSCKVPRTAQKCVSGSTAGAPVLQQLVQDTRLFNCSEIRNVLCYDRDAIALICLDTFVIAVAVRQCTEQSIVLIRREVISEKRNLNVTNGG